MEGRMDKGTQVMSQTTNQATAVIISLLMNI